MEQKTKASHYDDQRKNNTSPMNKLQTWLLGGCSHLEPLRHRRLGLLERPLQPEKRGTDIKKTITRENAKNQENENHSIEELTPRGEQLACRCPDRWASSHPASRSLAPRGQAQAMAQQLPLGGHREWRSCGQSLLFRRPRRDREPVAPLPGA